VCRTNAETQRLVNSHFERASAFWTDVYEREDVIALICQRRRDIALGWIDALELPVHGRVLEVGCGAGSTSVELAKRGFDVDATDTVLDMIELTRQLAAQANVSARLRTTVSDIHALEFEDQTFDAVVALGVLPWLHSPQTAMHELARVLKPGAHLVVSANNADRLPYLLDPKYNRALSPVRKAVKPLLGRLGVRRGREGDREGGRSRDPVAHMVTPKVFDCMLGAAGLSAVRGQTFGFGPFTFLGRQVLPQRLGLELHRRLERRAERGGRILRQRGHQYIVLAHRRRLHGPA
jgi:ubiquinone/menaquinone biosynthesis C-methylase UbiE